MRPGKYFPNIIDTKILTTTDEFLEIYRGNEEQ